ncbi:MAG: heat shock protein HspQ [Magnetococcales bacterium]|nr:heat shock protein HspQ [Magnetococcales bacterium]
MKTAQTRFFVGQIVHHNLFDYRGVVVDVDCCYQGDEQWYERMAVTRPPKDEPWYQILVDNSDGEAYVAEKNLESDLLQEPVEHPLVQYFFECFENGFYKKRTPSH